MAEGTNARRTESHAPRESQPQRVAAATDPLLAEAGYGRREVRAVVERPQPVQTQADGQPRVETGLEAHPAEE